MKKALLVIGHGSRSEEAKEIFYKIVDFVREGSNCDIVEGAFMELSKPTIPEMVEHLVYISVDEIILVPHFLYEGIHIKEDIPELVKGLSKKYKHILFKIAKPIGAEPALAEILLRRAEDAVKIS